MDQNKSKFKELPKLSTTWKIFYYGFSVILLNIFIKVYYFLFPISIDQSIGGSMGKFYWFNLIGPFCFLVELFFLIYAIQIGINSFKKGERSWILWLGFLHILIIIFLGLSYYNFIPNIF